MDIDLSKLSEPQLLELHRRIGERLKALREHRTRWHLTNFSVGDRVLLEHQHEGLLEGRVVRINAKTVSVDCNDGSRWRVSPVNLVNLSTPQTEVEPDPLTKEQKDLIAWAESQKRDRGKA